MNKMYKHSLTFLQSIFISSLLTYTPPTLGDYEYGSNAQAAGWLIGLFSFIPIPVWAAYKLVTTRGTLWQVSGIAFDFIIILSIQSIKSVDTISRYNQSIITFDTIDL